MERKASTQSRMQAYLIFCNVNGLLALILCTRVRGARGGVGWVGWVNEGKQGGRCQSNSQVQVKGHGKREGRGRVMIRIQEERTVAVPVTMDVR